MKTFNFYFLNKDYSFDIEDINTYSRGPNGGKRVSEIYSGLGSYFMIKNG